MKPEDVDARALTGSRHARDAYAARLARVGQTLLYHLLRQRVVLGSEALDERHGAAQHRDVAFEDAFHKFGHRRQWLAAPFQIRIDYGRLYHTAVYGQTGILGVVFGMFHDIILTVREEF